MFVIVLLITPFFPFFFFPELVPAAHAAELMTLNDTTVTNHDELR
jgi:hypothetical protein